MAAACISRGRWAPFHWKDKHDDADARLRRRAGRIAAALERTVHPVHGAGVYLLTPGGRGVAGWIHRQISAEKSDLDQLDRRELLMLIEGLSAYARRHGVDLSRMPAPDATPHTSPAASPAASSGQFADEPPSGEAPPF
jgi:hypothetical protein